MPFYFDDSSTILLVDRKTVSISNDDGATWTNVSELDKYEVIEVKVDPFVKERALLFTTGNAHFVTNDQGKTWSKFDLNVLGSDDGKRIMVNFNAEIKDYLLFEVIVCLGGFFWQNCQTTVLYSNDGCKSNPKPLLEGANSCAFAYSNRDFSADIPKETIICARNTENSFGHTTKSQLLSSSDLFKTLKEVDHPLLNSGKIISVRVDSAFILALIQKDKFNEKSEVSLLVSKDGKLFASSDLNILMQYGTVVFLESSPLSIFLSVIKPRSLSNGESTLYASDSTGLKFKILLEHMQPAAITKSQYVDGVWFTNILGEDTGLVSTPFGSESIYFSSQVSFNDGRDWDLLEIVDDDDCKITDGCSLQTIRLADVQTNDKFVTGPAPNILLTVGSPGKGHYNPKTQGTYVSRDGGRSWKLAISEPVIYVFADQGNIIAAMAYNSMESGLDSTDTFYYSLDQGKLFQTLKLDSSLIVELLVTTLDGSGTKVFVYGVDPKSKDKSLAYSIDFDKAFGGAKCKDEDFEVVKARMGSGQGLEPVCIRGHQESFKRRKQDAECLVRSLFEDIKVKEDPCECSASDFECSPYFDLSEKNACVPNMRKIADHCKLQKAKKVTLPHQKLISGNLCVFEKKKESDFVASTEFDCTKLDLPSDSEPAGGNGDISSSLTEISGMLVQYSYVNAGVGFADNILVNTDKHTPYASNDGGNSFVKIPLGDSILFFSVGPVPGSAVMLSEKYVYVSEDGANHFSKFKTPGVPASSGNVISFHPTDALKFIYFSGDGCNTFSGSGCTAFYTLNGGEDFEKLIEDSGRCAFVNEAFDQLTDLIFCTVANGLKRKLVKSANYFKDSSVLFEDALDFAVRSKFVFVATIAEDHKLLQAKVTSDGEAFADADFPSDLNVDVQTGYTVLDSGTQSIFLHVTTNKERGHEIGSILKSNSNGTFYVTSLPGVNRNTIGYVDFDRIDILEGVLVANSVSNPNAKEEKQLQTRISFNEGSEWHFLVPPAVDVDGKKYLCVGRPLSKCALHLQGFTERPDYRDTFLSTSAIGYLLGVGNVGEYLGSSSLSTFFSSDGGITWKEVRKGRYMWEFGDRGTILLLVDAENPTNEVIYSSDDGQTWKLYTFTDLPVQVWDLATVPSDTARKFLIFAGESGKLRLDTKLFSIDFTQFYPRQCQLDLDNPSDDDFDYWTPRHPESADNCLFGRETKYLRRATGHNDCFIGASPLEDGIKVERNCTCTRRDYECDYNYFADNDGTCKLVDGLSPRDRRAQMCSKNGTFQYFEPTGYRKIPSTTCFGGKSLDSWDARACPGHEKEFNEFYGRNMSWFTWFIVVLLPCAIFVFVTWFIYEKGIRRNGGFQRLGQIRLDDDDDFSPIEENNVDVAINRIVRGGIFVVAGLIAVFKTLRKVDRKVMEGLTGAIFGRRPGSRSYVRVPEEEDELFGNFEDNFEDGESGADFNFDVQLDPEIFDESLNEEPEADSGLFDIADDDSTK